MNLPKQSCKRSTILKRIKVMLVKAHCNISISETTQFMDSLFQFSTNTLSNIVLKRLTELANNPALKR